MRSSLDKDLRKIGIELGKNVPNLMHATLQPIKQLFTGVGLQV